MVRDTEPRDAEEPHRGDDRPADYDVDETYPEDDPRAVYDNDLPGEDRYDAYGEVPGEESGWWDEGVIATLFVVGLTLLLFPEPATSTVGLALIAVALVVWAIDWLR